MQDKKITGLTVSKKTESPDEEKIEAAVVLKGLKEMMDADPDQIVHEGEDGRKYSARDYVASILAHRMNNMPYYQKAFGIGKGTGRKVVGFQAVGDPEALPDELKGVLPNDAFIPVIQNDKTKSTGPMTVKASSDPNDEVQFITMTDLENIING